MVTIAKWTFVGARSVIGAFAVLSLLLGETWVRGWLRWALINWRDSIHQIAILLPFQLAWLGERILAFTVVLFVIVSTYVIDDPNVMRKASGSGVPSRDADPWPHSGFLSIMIALSAAAVLVATGEQPIAASFTDIRFLVAAFAIPTLLSVLTIGTSPNAALMTFGAVLALLTINYGLQFAHFLPRPPH